MNIYLNDKPLRLKQGTSLYALRQKMKADADVLIINGFPQAEDRPLYEGDHVVLIRRGEQPSPDELEVLMMARHTPGVHDKVKLGRVGIAGVGGLGSSVAIALARIGIGQLHIADFDVVEPSNLNRQQYFIDQIGMPKVEALKDILKKINPAVKINSYNLKITPDNLTDVFGDIDILVEAFDKAEEKSMLTSHFLHRFPNKYLVAASGVAGYEPSNSIQTCRITDHFYLCGDGMTAAAPGCGLMAPRVGIAAHHQANAVLRLLLHEPVG